LAHVTGTVHELNRYPVKSMAGEAVPELELFEHGAVGDRRYALTWREGQQLTARVAPGMLAWSAASGVNGDPAVLTAPDGRVWSWGDDRLHAALSDDLRKEVTLREDATLMQDLGDSVLVTVQSTLSGLRAELGSDVDLRRFRTNVHVDLGNDLEPFAETGWEGRTLRIGDCELDLLHPCVRCVMVTRDPDTQAVWPDLLRHLGAHHDQIFGINARPRGTGVIRVGDPVSLA
jgi:uncharacterized protein YcbX